MIFRTKYLILTDDTVAKVVKAKTIEAAIAAAEKSIVLKRGWSLIRQYRVDRQAVRGIVFNSKGRRLVSAGFTILRKVEFNHQHLAPWAQASNRLWESQP